MLGLGCWSIELEPNSFFLDRANYGLGFQVRLLRGQIRMVVALQYLQLNLYFSLSGILVQHKRQFSIIRWFLIHND